MKELTIDISGCTTALQFLDAVSKALGKPLGTFALLDHHLRTHYYPKIIFMHIKEFQERCPHATLEISGILGKVQRHYEKEGKEFEFSLQA